MASQLYQGATKWHMEYVFHTLNVVQCCQFRPVLAVLEATCGFLGILEWSQGRMDQTTGTIGGLLAVCICKASHICLPGVPSTLRRTLKLFNIKGLVGRRQFEVLNCSWYSLVPNCWV